MMRRALIPEQPSDIAASCATRAQKLTGAYRAHMETLARYRRGETKQRVVVEHVNVAPGAQAIVGAVSKEGGGGDDPKRGD